MICYVYTGGGCISAVLGELVGELASPPEAQEGLGTRDEMVSIDSPQKALHPGIYIPSMYLYKVCFDWRYMRDDGKKLTLRYFSDVFFFFSDSPTIQPYGALLGASVLPRMLPDVWPVSAVVATALTKTPVLRELVNRLGVREAGRQAIHRMFADGFQVN